MKKIFSAVMMISAACSLFAAAGNEPVKVKELKVLTIGNSFADSVFVYLPEVAKSFPDCKLVLDRANLGGCSLLRHWRIFSRTGPSGVGRFGV